MKTLSRSIPERISRPGAAALTSAVGASIADRISADSSNSEELVEALGKLSVSALTELARHALEAAIETLDSHPELTSKLMPGTTSAVRAQIVRGCTAAQVLRDQGYALVEIDLDVWQKLLDADLRSALPDSLGLEEAAGRREALLDDLGILRTEIRRYRGDRRVIKALSDRGPVKL